MSHFPEDQELGFRRRLRFARKRRGLDQQHVAQLSGASKAYVCQLESGIIRSPSIDWVSAIAIKIGISRRPVERLRQLRSGSPERLTLLATRPGNYADESALHERFAPTRISGEWFAPSEELLALVNKRNQSVLEGNNV